MNTKRIIDELEGIVAERTPEYVNLNAPQADEKLMKAHYLLAKLYEKKGDKIQASANFKAAEHEFYDLCRVETEQSDYVIGGLEGFRALEEKERKVERKLERFKGKLFKIATKLGHDATHLHYIPTSMYLRKTNLVI